MVGCQWLTDGLTSSRLLILLTVMFFIVASNQGPWSNSVSPCNENNEQRGEKEGERGQQEGERGEREGGRVNG